MRFLIGSAIAATLILTAAVTAKTGTQDSAHAKVLETTPVSVGDQDPRPGPGKPSGSPGAPPRRSTYCDQLNVGAGTAKQETYSVQTQALGLYRYPDGREDSTYTIPPVKTRIVSSERSGPIIIGGSPEKKVTEIVQDGGIPTHEKYRIWCQVTGKSETVTKSTEIWVPLNTPESVAERADLLAKVLDQLDVPNVNFRDIDSDHNWLWVQVTHHLTIDPPRVVDEREKLGDAEWGYAEAWVKATPAKLVIELPTESGAEYTSKCSLELATSTDGCGIKFTHSSSITDDGWFEGVATVYWYVTSNSGRYNKTGPFVTSDTFRIQVAEAMAVSGAGE